jgi:hypothetical protein
MCATFWLRKGGFMGTTRRPRYSKEEFARRGEEIFEKEIRPHLIDANQRDFVLIDIESGAFEVDANEDVAADRLETRIPDAQIWMRRVGSPVTRHFGGRGKEANQT